MLRGRLVSARNSVNTDSTATMGAAPDVSMVGAETMS